MVATLGITMSELSGSLRYVPKTSPDRWLEEPQQKCRGLFVPHEAHDSDGLTSASCKAQRNLHMDATRASVDDLLMSEPNGRNSTPHGDLRYELVEKNGNLISDQAH